MPWWITVPAVLGIAVVAWYLLLPLWMRRPSVKAQIADTFAREHAIRAHDLQEVSR